MNRLVVRHSLLLLLAAGIWGFAFVAQSVGMDYVGPFTFTSVRSIIGSAVLLPLIAIRSKREETGEKTIDKKGVNRTLLIGGILCGTLLFIATNFQQIGIQYTTVGKSGFVTAMYIVLVPVLGIFLHKKAGWQIWTSVGLAVCGLYFLCMTESSFAMELGDLLTLCCAVAFSFQILCVDYFAPKVDGVKLACIQFFTCGVLSALPMMVFEHPDPAGILAAWLPILYSGVLSNGVAYTLQIVAQPGLNPTVASLLMSMESVFSVLAGWLLLHQKLSSREMAGCVLMFVAIMLVQIRFKTNQK
ncbi:MAG: DMT family transporter [Agathobacter sp.]